MVPGGQEQVGVQGMYKSLCDSSSARSASGRLFQVVSALTGKTSLGNFKTWVNLQ